MSSEGKWPCSHLGTVEAEVKSIYLEVAKHGNSLFHAAYRLAPVAAVYATALTLVFVFAFSFSRRKMKTHSK